MSTGCRVRLGFLGLGVLLGSAAAMERLWYMPGGSDEAVSSFEEHAAAIDVVAPQVYTVRSDGSVHGQVDGRVLLAARRHNVHVMPLIMNPGFDQELLAALLKDHDAMGRVIDFMVHEARRFQFWGWQFDFENIHLADADRFLGFYSRASKQLHAAELVISIAAVPGLPASQPTSYHQYMDTNWRGVFWRHYKELADLSDFVSLMTYSQHTLNTPPGPIAGLPWMLRMLKYAELSIPPEKLSIGLPVYSNVWNAIYDDSTKFVRPSGGEIHHSRAVGMLASAKAAAEYHDQIASEVPSLVSETWDEREGVTMLVLENEHIREHVCLENARSFEVKVLTMLREFSNFRGFSVWVLGAEDPKVWPVVEALGAKRCQSNET